MVKNKIVVGISVVKLSEYTIRTHFGKAVKIHT